MIQATEIKDLFTKPDVFIKLYSKRLNQTVIIIPDQMDLKEHSGTYAIYRASEAFDLLMDLSDEAFLNQHNLRKEFQAIPEKR